MENKDIDDLVFSANTVFEKDGITIAVNEEVIKGEINYHLVMCEPGNCPTHYLFSTERQTKRWIESIIKKYAEHKEKVIVDSLVRDIVMFNISNKKEI